MASFKKYAAAGFAAEIVPIIPPGASLAPSSRVDPSQCGKIPGVYHLAIDAWTGMPAWNTRVISVAETAIWQRWPTTNVGLRASLFPAVDLDISKPFLVEILVGLAFELLGPAPLRGREGSERLLLPYRLADGEDAATKIRIVFKFPGDEKPEAVELLGAGQQYLVEGIHPSGAPYQWDGGIDLLTVGAAGLTAVTLQQWLDFAAAVEEKIRSLGGEIVSTARAGAGDSPRMDIGDPSLVAPDLIDLGKALAAIPVEGIGYDAFIVLLHAVKAACAGSEEFYENAFLPWVRGYGGADSGQERDEWTRAKWDSVTDSAIGAEHIYAKAREAGFVGGIDKFEPVEPDEDGGDGSNPSTPREETELAIATRFTDEFADKLRYIVAQKTWLRWNGVCWAPDETNGVKGVARAYCMEESSRQGRRGLPVAGQNKISSDHMANVLVRQAESTAPIPCTPDAFDADPWLLNTPGGIVDLKTGLTRQQQPLDMVSKMTRCAPADDEDCPAWRAFILSASGGQADLADFLQRCVGYTLTGATSEQKFFFIHGKSGSGKSTFMRTVTALLNTYQTAASVETFLASRNERHPTDLASLAGARLVQTSETPEGKFFDESRLKMLSGEDTVAARFMHGNFFNFRPLLKLWVVGNHRPHLRSPDGAIGRRLVLLPFNWPPQEPNLNLEEKLMAELPGILRWAINGCLHWQRQKLAPYPECVRAYTEDYLEAEERLKGFLDERTVALPGAWTASDELYQAYRQWCTANGEMPKRKNVFTTDMQDRGLVSVRRGKAGARGFLDIRLTDIDDERAGAA